MALGATRRSLAGLVIGHSVRLTLLGVGAGVFASAILGRLLSGLLFGVRTFDLETILLTIAILGSATTIAALLPAWRSTRVQPMIALRTD